MGSLKARGLRRMDSFHYLLLTVCVLAIEIVLLIIFSIALSPWLSSDFSDYRTVSSMFVLSSVGSETTYDSSESFF
jgi:hypothetical protein